jgi:hypothetical protein
MVQCYKKMVQMWAPHVALILSTYHVASILSNEANFATTYLRNEGFSFLAKLQRTFGLQIYL